MGKGSWDQWTHYSVHPDMTSHLESRVDSRERKLVGHVPLRLGPGGGLFRCPILLVSLPLSSTAICPGPPTLLPFVALVGEVIVPGCRSVSRLKAFGIVSKVEMDFMHQHTYE